MPAATRKARRLTDREVMIANRLSSEFTAKGEAEGRSQRSMAAEMGWTPGTLNQYLLANVPINYDALFKMCEYLKVDPCVIDPTLSERVSPPPNKEDLAALLKKVPGETAVQIIQQLGQSLTDDQAKAAAIGLLQRHA